MDILKDAVCKNTVAEAFEQAIDASMADDIEDQNSLKEKISTSLTEAKENTECFLETCADMLEDIFNIFTGKDID